MRKESSECSRKGKLLIVQMVFTIASKPISIIFQAFRCVSLTHIDFSPHILYNLLRKLPNS